MRKKLMKATAVAVLAVIASLGLPKFRSILV